MNALEKQLKSSKDRLQLVADCMPALVGYVDREQRYVLCNAAYEELPGMGTGL